MVNLIGVRLSSARDHLRLTYAPDNDGTGALRAEVWAGGFAGASSAWFDEQTLAGFCEALKAYPIDPRARPSLRGGYLAADGGYEQTHLAVEIAPYNGRGSLQVSVILAEPMAEDCPADRARSLQSWFTVGYNDLDRFRTALVRLLSGTVKEAVLTSASD